MGAANVTFTIGYSGKTLADFVKALHDAGVRRVVDVRALPLSRKKGFSKTALGEALSKEKIEYVHLRVAGNPYRDQKADISTCLALYSAYVDNHPEIIEAVEAAVEGEKSALLCFEADACECHRSVLTERLASRRPRLAVRNL